MGALTQYYVDPAIAGNSGTGTALDPFGDLQYALNTIVRDTTNGDQVNIKAGTAEVLAASLTLATYGTPAESAPLTLRGYTSAANDGGVAEINCNGSTLLAATTYSHLALIELYMHNFGDNNGIGFTVAPAWLIKCKVTRGASTPSGKALISSSGYTIGCYIYDAGTTGDGLVTLGFAMYNYVYNCPGTGILCGGYCLNNIVSTCGNGIVLNTDRAVAIGNSVYASAGTGAGINASNGAGVAQTTVLNNIIEGYSGAGGKGITNTGDIKLLGYNAFYNNATPESLADVHIDLGNDATLAASPFTNIGGGDFSLNTAVVGAIDGAFPGAWYGPASTTDHADIGAVQNGAGAGGNVNHLRGKL